VTESNLAEMRGIWKTVLPDCADMVFLPVASVDEGPKFPRACPSVPGGGFVLPWHQKMSDNRIRSGAVGCHTSRVLMSGNDIQRGPRLLREIASYHAHVYYEAASRGDAEQLRDWIAERFPVTLGRWHDVKVGPHGQAMYQVAFAIEVFPVLVPWLMINHGALSILVHPNTTNPRRDHADDALWIGAPIAVHADILPRDSDAEAPPAPNTSPGVAP
jgi:aromatic ring-cleaving dioxygenase